jgi:capsular exopolysaccharide synthesis family protein
MSFLKKESDANQSYVNQRRMLLNSHTPFHIQEAYRTLQTNLRFSLPGEGTKVICLTSGHSSEGKSTTVLNLAITFAESGKRVVLIDGDMRRPSLGRLLIEKASPGLSNHLAGLCTLEQAVRRNIRPGLDVIFSGEIPPNPLELLSSAKMAQLIEELKGHYDYILLDTPPVGIVSDACEVSSHTDGVLFLVHQNETEKETVVRGIRQLELANAKLLGFVLNGVIPNGSKGYKNKYKYGYKYKYGAYVAKNLQDGR